MADGSDGSHGSTPPFGPAGTLAARVAEATGTSVTQCYQCGRCAAGCMQNVQGEMDLSPTRVMRLLQLEAAFAADRAQAQSYADRALRSDTPWLCAGCLACTTRCPQEVDIAGVMDVLRQEALKRGVASRSKAAKDVQALHRSLLNNVLKRGRMHELSAIIAYKLRTGHLFQDAMLAPAMLLKGKLRILPGEGVNTQRLREGIERLRSAEEG